MTDGPDEGDAFAAHRRDLVGLAYRMLGSVAEAEDVVQDAFVRWHGVDRAQVAEPRAYLMRVVSRLCLDRMKSAAVRREQYVGMWLPEPLVASQTAEPAVALADDLSIALLLVLERLSPLERAAFLLHDVFDMDYGAIADVLEREEPATRQLAARARAHVKDGAPRYPAPPADADKLVDAFAQAVASGDPAALAELLAADAVLYSDGGGKRRAALNPIYGRDKIMRFMVKAIERGPGGQVARVHVNGAPGFLVRGPDGVETLSLEVVDGKIVAIYSIRNPDKLRHLA